jgi:hypothetical protein
VARQKPFKDLKDEEYGPVPKNLILGAQRIYRKVDVDQSWEYMKIMGMEGKRRA